MRVLTVCLGNICRSPTAEAAITAAADRRGLALDVDSAGTGDWHIGELPDARMREAASRVGLQLDSRARQVEPEDLTNHDLVLAMDRNNLTSLERMAVPGARIELFRVWDPEVPPGVLMDVPDPYYGGRDGFDEVVRIISRTADRLVADLAGE